MRSYISLGLFFYFKKIKVCNVENVSKVKPVLLLSNHQNALLDALLIATKCGRFTYFLTRAAVFKKPIIAKFLNSLQMIPVYRIRDGWGSISENNAIFESCTNFLNKNEAISIFPEGNHNFKRTVRPLSKGFTRIVFGTLKKYPQLDLQLIPTGLNFRKAKAFPDSVSMYFGQPIDAQDYNTGTENERVVKLKSKIQGDISQLTTNIPSEGYDEILQKLQTLNVDFLDPRAVNNCIETDFTDCEFKVIKPDSFVKKLIRVLTICNLIAPFLIWKYVVKSKIKEEEFISTFRFALCITLVPIWLLVLVLLISVTLGWFVGMSYLVCIILLMLLFVKW
jgi:1-acyl-sn-glycerol-3-phosphate acyltransferase